MSAQRRNDLAVVVVSLVAIVGLLMAGAVGIELAGGDTIATLGLIGGLAVTPVVVALVPLLSRSRNAEAASKTAAANSEEVMLEMREVRGELNGKMDARMRAIVREEMPGLIDESVRRVLAEMPLWCPRDSGVVR